MLENYQRVCAFIDLDAVCHNLEQMHGNMSENTKIIGVIKTDGYGHGAVQIGREMEKMDFVFGYAVATAEEAIILRRAGLCKPILILGYSFPYAYEDLIRYDIRLAVFREDTIRELSECAHRIGKPIKVHVKVDTGMTRVGIKPDDSGIAFTDKVLHAEGVELEGMFTHFARADETDKTMVRAQLKLFRDFVSRAEKQLDCHIPIKHCSNSAGIVELPEANMDVVRAGITLYGLWPSEQVSRNIVELKPALSLKSHIVYIKEVNEGVAISYGGTYVTPKKMKVATIPVGYGDGYPRGLSNKGYVLIRGRKVPILGRVCMDQFMVSVDEVPEATEGDEVTLIGTDGERQITMEELGGISGRFNYELACDLGKRVPRVYIKNGQITETKDYFDDYR